MTNPDELHALVDALPEEARERARVLLIGLLHGVDDGLTTEDLAVFERAGRTGDAVLDEVEADPALRARFLDHLDRVEADVTAGKFADGPTFMARVREASKRRLAGA